MLAIKEVDCYTHTFLETRGTAHHAGSHEKAPEPVGRQQERKNIDKSL